MSKLPSILTAILFALPCSATVDGYHNDQPVIHCTATTDLTTPPSFVHYYPGNVATVDNAGGLPMTFVAFPAGTFTCSAPHCYTFVGAPSVQWADIYTILNPYNTWTNLNGKPTTFTPAPHETTHLLGGSDAIAGLSPGQIAACPANQTIVGNGSANACAQLLFSQLGSIPTPSCAAPVTCPASLSSGSFGINLVSHSSSGAVSSIGSANTVLLSPNGTSSTWAQVADAFISDVAFSKLTGVPSTFPPSGISGTSNTLAKFTGASTLGNSGIADSGSLISTSETLRSSSEIQTTSMNAFRMVAGNYGAFFRFDGTSMVLRATASGDQYGSWSSWLPLFFDATNGNVQLANATISAQQSNNRVGINTSSPATTLDVNGVATIRGGSPATGYLCYSTDPNGTIGFSTAAGLGLLTAGAPIVFGASLTNASVTQAATSGVPHDMTVEAQSASTNSYAPANLNLNAGFNTGGGIGSIDFGYAGNVGAFGTVGSTGAAFQGPLSATDKIFHVASTPSESHIVSRNAGFAVSEDVQWFRAPSAGVTPVNIDVTTWQGSAGIPDNHTYHATYEIDYDGASWSTITAVGTWTKANGTLTAREGIPGINGLAITVGASNPTANTMRFAITPPVSNPTTWTVKVHITQN